MAGACTGIHRLTRASEFRACVSFGDTSRCRAVGRQADMFVLEWRQALTGWYPVPSSTRADSNTYMKLRARSHERPMTMKCWLWCQRKVCNDDADSCFTRVVAYRPALVCRKAPRLRHARTRPDGCPWPVHVPVFAYRPALVCRKAPRLRHARTTRSPCYTSPCRPAPKRLPSPDAPQSPLFGLNRKDYSPFVPHGLGKARIFVLIQTESGVFDTVGHVCPARTGSDCTRCTYAHTHTSPCSSL